MIYHCKTHGRWDANHESGCPECTRELRAELTQAKAELSTLRAECERLRENRDGLQARIDELMLEYCLDEMTEQQWEEYEKNQIAVALDRKDQP